jgi:hypothetical protein
MGFKFAIGDKVVIARKAVDRVAGEFENSWISSMDAYVGKPATFTVYAVNTSGVSLNTSTGIPLPNRWPPGALDFAQSQKGTAPVELKIEDRVYVNGNNAADLKDDQLISLISDAETEIAALDMLATSSAAIRAKIVGLQAGAKKLAALLDARLPPPIG